MSYREQRAGLDSLINQVELWAIYSVLNNTKNGMKVFLGSLFKGDLVELIIELNLSPDEFTVLPLMVNICAERYFDKFNDPKGFIITKYPEKSRLREFARFIRAKSLTLRTERIIYLLKKNGMCNFRYMFGDDTDITDIVGTNSNMPYHLISMSDIKNTVTDEFADYIFNYLTSMSSYHQGYTETVHYFFNMKYHPDFVAYIRTYLYSELWNEMYYATERIVDDGIMNELDMSGHIGHIAIGSFTDVICRQEIKINILYDKELVFEQEECCICNDNMVNISLKCRHTLCDGCIKNMIENVKSDSRLTLRCPFCNEEIKEVVANSSPIENLDMYRI